MSRDIATASNNEIFFAYLIPLSLPKAADRRNIFRDSQLRLGEVTGSDDGDRARPPTRPRDPIAQSGYYGTSRGVTKLRMSRTNSNHRSNAVWSVFGAVSEWREKRKVRPRRTLLFQLKR